MRTAPPPASTNRAARLLLVAAVAAGLGLRLLHLHAVRPLVDAEGAAVGMDRWLNTQVATAIARGNWDGGWAVAYDSSPAYSYALAGLYAAGGWTLALAVQVVCGAATPLLLYDVGRRLYGVAVGALAAVLAALYAPAIFYEGLLVKFGLVPVLTSAVLVATVRLRERCGTLAAGVAGLTLGALALLRPNAAVVAPLALGWALRQGPPRAVVRTVAAAAMGAAVLVAPMAARDRLAAAHGLAGSLWGIHFYIGNHADADGEYVEVPGVRADPVGHVEDAGSIAQHEEGRALTAEEVSRYWFRRGLGFVREHPVRWIGLEGRKLWLAFAAGERGSFGDEFAELAAASPVLRLPLVGFGVVAPLGLLGIVATLRGRRPALLPLVVAGLACSLLPFFVAGRYRLPLAPPMLVLAGVGLATVARWTAERPRTLRAVAAGAGLATVAVGLGARDVEVAVLLVVLVLGVPVARELDADQRPT